MNRLEKCIGSLKCMRDYSDPYEVDADAIDYAIESLNFLEFLSNVIQPNEMEHYVNMYNSKEVISEENTT